MDVLSKLNIFWGILMRFSSSLFKCLIPMESNYDITLVFKANVDVILVVKLDNGSAILVDESDKDLIVRHWKRK